MVKEIFIYRTFGSYLVQHFGCKMGKIGLSLHYPCPQQPPCLFCNQSSFIPSSLNDDGSISEQIIKALPYLSQKYQTDKFIAYFQDNTSTAVPLPVLADAVKQAVEFEQIRVISFSTRPDYLNNEILDTIENHAGNKKIWIELGMQSANEQTLINIHRGHTFAELETAVNLLKSRNIAFGLQIIVGLPNESREDILNTFRAVNQLNPTFCKIHHLQVVKGSELADLYQAGNYTPLSMPEYLELLKSGLALLNNNITITRVLSDAHPDELIAPRWNVSKAKFLNLLHNF